jgi:hypothetical protein
MNKERVGMMKITKRHEFKYVISMVDYLILKEKLKHIMEPDKHSINNPYKVSSIYFDDIHLGALYDKLSGNETHRKYRIRYYNDQNVYQLEEKHKVGNFSTKSSSQIDSSILKTILNGDYYDLISKEQLLNKFAIHANVGSMKPTCIVEYERDAFVSKDGNSRVTFDLDVRGDYYDEDATKSFLQNKVILEVKYTNFLPKEIKDILKLNTFSQQSISKYALTMNALH